MVVLAAAWPFVASSPPMRWSGPWQATGGVAVAFGRRCGREKSGGKRWFLADRRTEPPYMVCTAPATRCCGCRSQRTPTRCCRTAELPKHPRVRAANGVRLRGGRPAVLPGRLVPRHAYHGTLDRTPRGCCLRRGGRPASPCPWPPRIANRGGGPRDVRGDGQRDGPAGHGGRRESHCDQLPTQEDADARAAALVVKEMALEHRRRFPAPRQSDAERAAVDEWLEGFLSKFPSEEEASKKAEAGERVETEGGTAASPPKVRWTRRGRCRSQRTQRRSARRDKNA